MKKLMLVTILVLLCVHVMGSVNSARAAAFSTSNSWWGAAVSDTGWDRWGSFFRDAQIGIMKEAGATAVRIMLDKYPWDTKNTGNCLGIPYPDYIKQLVAWSKPELKVELELALDSRNGDFAWQQKEKVLTTPSLRSEWINWGKSVIAYCKPDAICIMGEPGGGGSTLTFDYYYNNFVVPSISAYRSVDQEIGIFVMGYPFYDLSGFFNKPVVNDATVYYCIHGYYNPSTDSSPVETAYALGDFVKGKQLLYQEMDKRLGPLPKSRVCFHEFGVDWGVAYPDEPNWKVFSKDLYDYVSNRQMLGLFQFAFSKVTYQMIDSRTGYSKLTDYGQFWADNLPKGSTPRTNTRLYFNLLPNPVRVGTTVTLRGVLVDDASDPISSVSVRVEYSVNNGVSWTSIWTLTTNSYGIFSQTFAAPAASTYLMRVTYAGDATHQPSVNNAYIVVLSASNTASSSGSIYFNFLPNPANSGRNVILEGILVNAASDPISSASVRVEYSVNNGVSWTSIWTLTTNSYGIFSQTFSVATGTYLVRATYGSMSMTSYLVVFP
jgi:hypothetical protein